MMGSPLLATLALENLLSYPNSISPSLVWNALRLGFMSFSWMCRLRLDGFELL
ncbi:hypothetical protein Hanom_Chr08g00682621 [Helianthus anomalus]